jgi:hypothetical protein
MHLLQMLLEVIKARPILIRLRATNSKASIDSGSTLVNVMDGQKVPVQIILGWKALLVLSAFRKTAFVRSLMPSRMFP